jgi:hypothetical protein
MALCINTVRTVKLLNGTQNVWASDLSDWKILIKLERGSFSLDIFEKRRPDLSIGTETKIWV